MIDSLFTRFVHWPSPSWPCPMLILMICINLKRPLFSVQYDSVNTRVSPWRQCRRARTTWLPANHLRRTVWWRLWTSQCACAYRLPVAVLAHQCSPLITDPALSTERNCDDQIEEWILGVVDIFYSWNSRPYWLTVLLWDISHVLVTWHISCSDYNISFCNTHWYDIRYSFLKG